VDCGVPCMEATLFLYPRRFVKFPKNRANVYVVTRENENTGSSVLGVFPEFDEAENFRAAAEQEFLEKVGRLGNYFFIVSLSTFYG